jgi:uncharacterized protein YoxC
VVEKFFEALWNTRDPALTSAFAAMQAAVDELAKTVGLASYAAIRSTQDQTWHISEKTDRIDEDLRNFREQQSADFCKLFEANLQTIQEVQKVGDSVQTVGDNVQEVGDHVLEILKLQKSHTFEMSVFQDTMESIRVENAKASA